jgi:DNA-3-methyladenine glycosylase
MALLYNFAMQTIALASEFYSIPAPLAARALLGMRLVRCLDGVRLSGIISETEAYRGEEDLACPARAGRTARTRLMYGPPGLAYIYFTYGMHWMLNVVCEGEDFPAAVLIRAVQVTEGQEQVALRRAGVKPAQWSDGPAKLCKAFGIDGSLNGINLCKANQTLWIEPGQPVADLSVTAGPRIGIDYAPEPWRSIPWRFRVVSAPGAPSF